MKRASHTLYKGDKVQLQYLYFFPLTCSAQSKGRIFHRCWRNLYEMNSNTNFTNLSRLKNENL